MLINTKDLKAAIGLWFDRRPASQPVSVELNESQRAHALGTVEDVERWADFFHMDKRTEAEARSDERADVFPTE